ncbi:MAG TPA: hypothetical protein VEI97_03325, partial [bacterium]|nr:hypothetical protein [bacterium]
WGGNGGDFAYGIAITPSGTVYVVGWFAGTVDFDPGPAVDNHTAVGSHDAFLVCYTGTGYQWAWTWGGAEIDAAWDVMVDPLGDLVVSGRFQGTVDFDPGAGSDPRTSAGEFDAYVARFTGAGTYLWARTYGGPTGDFPWAAGMDAAGQIYAGGGFTGTSDFDPGPGTANRSSTGGIDAYVVSFTNGGDFRWAATWGGGAGVESVEGMGVRGSTVCAAGYFSSGSIDADPGPGTVTVTSNGGYEALLSNFSADGTLAWARSWGGPGDDFGTHAAVDHAGNVIACGNFNGTVDFDPGAGTNVRTAAGFSDVYLNKFTPAGSQSWVATAGGPQGEFSYTVAVDGANNLFLVGAF